MANYDSAAPDIQPGSPVRLGAHWDGKGTNFALFSAHAERVELCLFDESGARETARITLPEYTNEIWHGYLPGVGPGHALRLPRAWPLRAGAAAIASIPTSCCSTPMPASWSATSHGRARISATRPTPRTRTSPSTTRTAPPVMPKGRVVDPEPTTGAATRARRCRGPRRSSTKPTSRASPSSIRRSRKSCAAPSRAWGTRRSSTTSRASASPRSSCCRSTPSPTTISSLKRACATTGATTRSASSRPASRYYGPNGLAGFRDMVRAFHDAGIEVILDVVYNHTAEGNEMGPTLSFKGIDNFSYYRTMPGDARYYINDTGTGNTVNTSHPRVLQMVTDSLRYWAEEMHVDGFRFDLGTILGREPEGFDQRGGFFDAVGQDPVLAKVKLIGEPWDIGPGGYQVGGFPPGWAEWNDKYRDTVRDYWKNTDHTVRDFAARFTGSGDVYDHARPPALGRRQLHHRP